MAAAGDVVLGKFGWLEFSLNQTVVLVLTGLLIVAVLLAFRRRGLRGPLLVLLSLVVVAGVLLFRYDVLQPPDDRMVALAGLGGLIGGLVPLGIAAFVVALRSAPRQPVADAGPVPAGVPVSAAAS